jgi:hypothetical protein
MTMSDNLTARFEQPTFRDAIAAAVSLRPRPDDFDRDSGDAVLAMPEMAEVKAFFRWFSDYRSDPVEADLMLRRSTSLSPAFIDWIMAELPSTKGNDNE